VKRSLTTIASTTDVPDLGALRMAECLFTLMRRPQGYHGHWAAFSPAAVGVFVAKGRRTTDATTG
jgi:hypothetical protein